MDNIYEFMSKQIESGSFDINEMKENLDMFKLYGRITKVQYQELMDKINEHAENESKTLESRLDVLEEGFSEILEMLTASEPEDEPVEEPADEPIDKPAEEPSDEPINEPTEEPSDEPINEPAEEPAEEPVDEPADEPKDESELTDKTAEETGKTSDDVVNEPTTDEETTSEEPTDVIVEDKEPEQEVKE
jgi:hypothetical protein